MIDNLPTILSIDPGPTESGVVVLYGRKVEWAEIMPNDMIGAHLLPHGPATVAIEQICAYGMIVGQEVFDTAVVTGRFQERFLTEPYPVHMIPRRFVKLHLCGVMTAKDANVRQAVRDKFPKTGLNGKGKACDIGTKKHPGPLKHVTGHAWQALALALYAQHLVSQPGYEAP